MSFQYRLRQFAIESEMRGTPAAIRLLLLAILKRLLTPKNPDFDKTYGTVTNEVVEVADGDIPQEGFDTAIRYAPTSSVVIAHICKKLPIDHRDYIFVDMGCGRGRVLMLASEFPFEKIIGVEISESHCEIALENVAIYKSPGQKCQDITVVCQNVAAYLPPSHDLVVYMYQPFGGPVLRTALTNLQEIAGDDHSVFLCFSAPYYMQDVIQQSLYFHLIDHFPTFGNTDNTWTLYGNARAVTEYLNS